MPAADDDASVYMRTSGDVANRGILASYHRYVGDPPGSGDLQDSCLYAALLRIYVLYVAPKKKKKRGRWRYVCEPMLGVSKM